MREDYHVDLHVHIEPDKAEIRRLRRANHALTDAVEQMNVFLDAALALNLDQAVEIDAVKAQRDALNEEIESAKAKLDADDLDPSFPPTPQFQGE